MSSTNRGATRIESDFYATPREAFEPMIPFISKMPSPIWEPACGDRRLIDWLNGVEIECEGDDITNGYDYLKDQGRVKCVVTNPPFSLAFEFCQHAVEHSENVFLLLRLNFLASQKRRDWFRDKEPSALFILSKRPCFTGNGKTDSTDYAWFYWGRYPFRPINHL